MLFDQPLTDVEAEVVDGRERTVLFCELFRVHNRHGFIIDEAPLRIKAAGLQVFAVAGLSLPAKTGREVPSLGCGRMILAWEIQ